MNGITLTAEYLLNSQNIQPYWESRHTKDSSEWKLYLQTFARTTQVMGKPSVDLFASRLPHQLPGCMLWKLDPCCMSVDVLQQKLTHMFSYASTPFSVIEKVLRKIQENRVTVILITARWQSQPWYPWLLKMSIRNPILLPNKNTFLMKPQGSTHPLIELGSLRLAALLISRSEWRQWQYLKVLQSLS